MPPCSSFIALRLTCVACLLPLALATAAHASGWDDSDLSPQEMRERYGRQQGAITTRDAEELMLDMVNAARSAAGSTELGWSEDAQTMAQLQADAMAQGHFGAHFDLDGRGPDLRWNALGGTDHIGENVIYYEVPTEVALTPELLWSMLSDWVLSPGHFANLNDWHHTSLGFAVSIEVADGVSYVAGVQEYVTDLGDYSLLPETAAPGETLALSGTLLPQRIELAGIALGAWPLPEAQTAESLNSAENHYPAPEFAWLDPGQIEADAESGEFLTRIPLPDNLAESSAYITVWARYEDDAGDAAPFCVMTQVVQVLAPADESPEDAAGS